MSKKPQLSLADCKYLAGNSNAAMLLYRMQLWQDRTKIERGGYKWMTSTREDWMKQTGLSLSQYNRAMARLKKLNIIESERHLFQNKVVAFIRLSDAYYSYHSHVADLAPLDGSYESQPSAALSYHSYNKEGMKEGSNEAYAAENNLKTKSKEAIIIPSTSACNFEISTSISEDQKPMTLEELEVLLAKENE